MLMGMIVGLMMGALQSVFIIVYERLSVRGCVISSANCLLISFIQGTYTHRMSTGG